MTPVVRYQRHQIATDDGVTLPVQETGAGPAVLVANGIGVTAPGLDILVDHLRPRHRVILWDYRGLGASRAPRPDIDVSMARQARDALAVLDALGEPRAAVLGWSMGVPVGLELIRRAPGRVAAFGALFGAADRPFRHAFPRPVSDAVHALVHLGRLAPLVPAAVLGIGDTLPWVAWQACTLIRFVGRGADRPSFAAQVRAVRGADMRLYFRTLAELMEHDASDVLPAVRCPVLAVAGEHDWATPPVCAEALVRQVRGARLVVLPGTTHFGVIEHGPALWGPVDELLAAGLGRSAQEGQRVA